MRKATGIVRRIDDLGRIVIPKELRRTLGIVEGDPLEFYVSDKEEVILKKYQPGCILCGNMERLLETKGKSICSDCVEIVHRISCERRKLGA